MSTLPTFWNLYPLFYEQDKPPVIVCKVTGKLVRHAGGSTRCGFWAGYDGIKQGARIGQKGSVTHSAYRAGIAYRKAVEAGKRAPLPDTY